MLRFVKSLAVKRLKLLQRSFMATRSFADGASEEKNEAKNSQEQLHRLIAARLRIPVAAVRFVVEQTKKGSTVPFLARYRRDETGHLDETALRQLIEVAEELQEVNRRREFMLKSLKSRGLLTEELRAVFEKFLHLNQLEDAWEPFKEKRTSLSYRAREVGLDPLAKKLLYTSEPADDIPKRLSSLVDGDKLFQAIIVEEVQRCGEARQLMLVEFRKGGVISSSLVENPRKKSAKEVGAETFETIKKNFAAYENRRWSVQRINAHNILALQRGEKKGALMVKMIAPSTTHDVFFAWARRKFSGLNRHTRSTAYGLLVNCLESAYTHLLKTTQNIVRRDLMTSAQKEAIAVFAHSLRHILMQCPMRDARLLAMDPGVTNGVKCVALNEDGAVLTRFKCSILDKENMKNYIASCVEKLNLNKIVIGNGTASRRVADIVADTIDQKSLKVEYAIVSEAGASVYSVSDVAKEEFPTLDPMYRGAVSIGRRVIDPLSELVKIPVRSMGIGMYQHDMSETALLRALTGVLESCVTCVGVNALVANRYVMEKVPGVTKRIVDQIVLARHAKKLKSREDLRRVPGMTETMYQQIAGFFRFPNSFNPLDNSNIHPESYATVQKLLELYEGKERKEVGNILLHAKGEELHNIATCVGCGKATLELLASELASPALDPRSALPHAGLFRRAPQKIEDLKPGQKLKGVVQSVTTFGAFVDVGLHDNVLVRGVNIDTVHTGGLLEDICFEGVDQLGRPRVRYDGPVHACNKGLALESEDVLQSHPTTASEALSSSLAAVRDERRQLFLFGGSPLTRSGVNKESSKRPRADKETSTGGETAVKATHPPLEKRRRVEKQAVLSPLSLQKNSQKDVSDSVGDQEPWWQENRVVREEKNTKKSRKRARETPPLKRKPVQHTESMQSDTLSTASNENEDSTIFTF